MPDETLYFNTGSNRDKSLLFYTLLQQSPIADEDTIINLFGEKSHVEFDGIRVVLNNVVIDPELRKK